MPETIRVECTHCGQRLKLPGEQSLGATFRCPRCAKNFVAERTAGDSLPQAEPVEQPENATVDPDEQFLANLDALGSEPVETYRPAPLIRKKAVRPAPKAASQPGQKVKKRSAARRSDRLERFAVWTWPLFGMLSGSIATLIWTAISYFSHKPAGLVAVLLGLMVGMGVRIAAGERDGWTPGLVAAGTAMSMILVSQLIVTWVLLTTLPTDPEEIEADTTPRQMVIVLAREVVAEREAKGIKVGRPADPAFDDADQFPDDVWNEAQARWDAKTPEEQQDALHGGTHSAVGVAGLALLATLVTSFLRPTNLVWLLLAGLAAFRIGSNATD